MPEFDMMLPVDRKCVKIYTLRKAEIMEKARILQNKTYLYLTEFFAGMSVMAVELGASRLLAPYFSSSQIVWTIIIGTIMIAMRSAISMEEKKRIKILTRTDCMRE